MIRKINYTGRHTISKDRITVRQDLSAGANSFDIDLNIGDLEFPDDAKIYIEPYFKASFMRFDFGTIARKVKPASTELTDIPITDRVLYRVKIVDESNNMGLILGFADEVMAETSNDHGNKSPLLPVDFNDLGSRIWKLEFREEGPVLAVNCDVRIEKIREIVSKDMKFRSLVYPEVVRQIALNIAKDEDFDFNDNNSSWQHMWLKFFKKSLSITHAPISREVTDGLVWADEIADAFCRKNKMITLLES